MCGKLASPSSILQLTARKDGGNHESGGGQEEDEEFRLRFVDTLKCMLSRPVASPSVLPIDSPSSFLFIYIIQHPHLHCTHRLLPFFCSILEYPSSLPSCFLSPPRLAFPFLPFPVLFLSFSCPALSMSLSLSLSLSLSFSPFLFPSPFPPLPFHSFITSPPLSPSPFLFYFFRSWDHFLFLPLTHPSSSSSRFEIALCHFLGFGIRW
jgi:hypothetical protein